MSDLNGRKTFAMNRKQPASARIDNYPYLVQRLRWTGEADKNPYHTTDKGPPQERKVGDYFNFDYMGSAEFEWGAIPAAKRRLRALLEGEGWGEPREIKVEEHVCWYVGPKAQYDLAVTWFTEELSGEYTGMKEISNLKTAYTSPETWSPNGWWAIDGGERPDEGRAMFALFIKKDHARDFIKGVRG